MLFCGFRGPELRLMPICDHIFFFFFSSRRRHTRFDCDWSSDVCSSDLTQAAINQVIQSCFLIPVPFVQPPTAANPNPPSWPFPNVRKTYFDPKYSGWQQIGRASCRERV